MINIIDANKTYTDLYGRNLNNVVVFGDDTVSNIFRACVSMEFWGENCITLQEEGIEGEPTLKDEVIELDLGSRKLQWCKAPPENSSLKWVEILNEKPASNVWSLKIGGDDQFDYLYQTPLAIVAITIPGSSIEYFKKDGVDWVRLIWPNGNVDSRPLEIDGSVAVYHKTKRFNIVGHKNYRTGKVLHILRPKAVDADNNEEWCDIEVKDGVYIRTIPQAFLDTAIYPVRINDTFGYTTIGGTSSELEDDAEFAYGPYTCPSAGTATSVSIYMTNLSGQSCTFGYWEDSSNYPGDLVANTGNSSESSDGWVEKALSGSVSAVNYYIGGNVDGATPTYKFDSDASYERNHKTGITYIGGFLSDPFPAGATVSGSRRYSAFITYTPSGVGIVPQAVHHYKQAGGM